MIHSYDSNVQYNIGYQSSTQTLQRALQKLKLQKIEFPENVDTTSIIYPKAVLIRQTYSLQNPKLINIQKLNLKIMNNNKANQWAQQLQLNKKYSFKIDKQFGSFLIQSYLLKNTLIINGMFLTFHLEVKSVSNLFCQILYQKLNSSSTLTYLLDPITDKNIKFILKLNNYSKLSPKNKLIHLQHQLSQLQNNLQLVLRVERLLNNQARPSKFKNKLKKKMNQLQKNIGLIYQEQKMQKYRQQQMQIEFPQNQIVFQNVKAKSQTVIGNQIFSGGFFTVKKCKVELQITDKQTQIICQQMAVKELKGQRQKYQGKTGLIYYSKMSKQQSLLKKVKNTSHFLKYYYPQSNTQTELSRCFMQYAQYDLFAYLKFNQFLNIYDLLQLSNQILQAVKHLHQAQIVHRDIKPSNIMIKQEAEGIKIKLIDFSQSAYIPDFDNCHDFSIFQTQQYGYTFPYSPVECSQFRKIKQTKSNQNNGIRNKQIDYWSVGVVLHQIFANKNAINYFKPYYDGFIKLFECQFQTNQNKTKLNGIQSVLPVVRLVFSKMTKIKQTQRSSINSTSQIFQNLTAQMKEVVNSF